MSCITLNLTDHQQTKSGHVHGHIGDAVIAALSAEPETIQELELALARFVKPKDECSHQALLRPGENLEPYDSGIVIVDLAARVAMIDSTYAAPMVHTPAPTAAASGDDFGQDFEFVREQELFWVNDEDVNDAYQSDSFAGPDSPPTYELGYHDGERLTDVRLLYRLPHDWLFVNSLSDYADVCLKRRAERKRIEWFDPRDVLFGKRLSEFLTREIATATNLDAGTLFTEIHAKWLSSPRDDLQGRSPRDWLLAKKEFIDFDLHARELQWSFTAECPPPLLPTCHAYRFAGFGTHEIVIYYDLVRLLLAECYTRAREKKNISIEEETERLEQIKNAWLEMSDPDNNGKAPALIIEWERRRIPLAMSGKEAIIDEDCPICQAAAEDFPNPMFWHIDGCHMDGRFEFSYFITREQWEADKRRREVFNRKFDRRWKKRQARATAGSFLDQG